MDCKNKIIDHDLFQDSYYQIQQLEKKRIFCKHDMVHFLDVARLMMILSVKEKLDIKEDLIYAAALLHDIGRHEQYRHGIEHHIASANIAKCILDECDFCAEDRESIIEAILMHRNKNIAFERNLSGLLYRADKMSRNCFCCEARSLCNWSDDKKNLKIKY